MRTPSTPPTRTAPTSTAHGPATAAAARLARQKAALKANMARRKAQAQARTAIEADGETKNKD
jgi:hypothetical protein